MNRATRWAKDRHHLELVAECWHEQLCDVAFSSCKPTCQSRITPATATLENSPEIGLEFCHNCKLQEEYTTFRYLHKIVVWTKTLFLGEESTERARMTTRTRREVTTGKPKKQRRTLNLPLKERLESTSLMKRPRARDPHQTALLGKNS